MIIREGVLAYSMKIQYFAETDTLYIELRSGPVVESRDLDDYTQVDVDEAGTICAVTFEHATATPESQAGAVFCH